MDEYVLGVLVEHRNNLRQPNDLGPCPEHRHDLHCPPRNLAYGNGSDASRAIISSQPGRALPVSARNKPSFRLRSIFGSSTAWMCTFRPYASASLRSSASL